MPSDAPDRPAAPPAAPLTPDVPVPARDALLAALAEEAAGHARARQALLERTRELEAIFQALPDLYFRLDADLRILDYRASATDRLYVPPEAFLGRRLRDVMPPDITARFDAALGAAEPGALVTVEYRLPVEGGARDFEARFLPFGDGTRIAVVRDVTERVAPERALREREEHFRTLIENASDFVMTCDATGALTYVAPSSARMLGYEPREMLGTRPGDQFHPDDVPAAALTLAQVAERPGETVTATFRVRNRAGAYRVFEYRARTISADSAAQGIIAFARDVTDRRQAEEALARAKEEAEAANRAKSEFLSRMSHELRTPMNSILGFAQLLARAELPAAHGRSVQHILKAGRHLLQLINEVLEIARIEAGREHFSLEPVALAPALREAAGLVRPLAQQAGVELREGAWPSDAWVHADRQRLVQVLLNLLSNAIKYNRPAGYVRLACAADGPGRWAVRVEDGGPGIADDRVHQLFTPFARLGAETTEVEGTGLGLALSRRLTEAMGGTLALESTGPAGSVFRLALDAAHDPRAELDSTGTFPALAAPHRDATLLYVEDNLANLSLVETILEARPGWRTIPALQGQLGVELAREHQPDAVLLDLHLPDISGEEVLRRLRSDPRTAYIPVIVVSADATPSSLERLRAAGADAYLTKPLDVDEFLRVLERFLD
jgi:PAS domain S-box-containing protein